MSSQAIIQKRDSVHLITDAAHYDTRSVIVGIASKVYELPRSNSVLTGRGAMMVSLIAMAALSPLTCFDDVIRALPCVLEGIDAARQGMAPHLRHAILTAIGWSDSYQRVMAAAASTYAPDDPADSEGWITAVDGYQQYAPISLTELGAMPPIDTMEVLGRDAQSVIANLEDLDPRRDGLAIFESQRRFPSVNADHAAYVVGGFAELTTITRDGITREILREYPEDQPGALICPEGAEPIADVWAREIAYRAAA